MEVSIKTIIKIESELRITQNQSKVCMKRNKTFFFMIDNRPTNENERHREIGK
jgi:hypothetical protein